MKVHDAEKTFVCDQCDYKSTRLGDLKSHKKVHSVEKPFKCDECNFETARSSDYKKHKRRRHPTLQPEVLRPFPCDQCSYRGATPFDLKNHQNIHSGLKPFKCDICEFQTAHPASLRRHEKVHSTEQPYECSYPQCTFRAKDPAYLKAHFKRMHQRTPAVEVLAIEENQEEILVIDVNGDDKKKTRRKRFIPET